MEDLQKIKIPLKNGKTISLSDLVSFEQNLGPVKIERIDRELEPILNLDFSRVCLILTGDHSTPVMVREHTADPVPVIILHEGVRVDEVKQFSEFEAYKGGLCRIRGMDLTNIALDLIDKAKKFGA